MAIQLREFLVSQLSDLPSEHPDRGFIKSTLNAVDRRLERVAIILSAGRSNVTGEHIANYFEVNKTGPYYDPAEITALLETPGLTPSYRDYGRQLISDVESHGDDALAHLSLPTALRNKLKRGQVTDIPSLIDRLDSGTALVGRQEMNKITLALSRFDARRQQSQITTR